MKAIDVNPSLAHGQLTCAFLIYQGIEQESGMQQHRTFIK